jgi:hypothetical protein
MSHFPYRKFDNGRYTPLSLMEATCGDLGEYTTYISAALTNGGIENDQKTQWDPKTVITLNTLFASALAEWLAELGHIEPNYILPHALGRVFKPQEQEGVEQSWQQIDYLLFWSMTMMRLQPKQARVYLQQIEKAEIDITVFNNKQLPPKVRWQQYQKISAVVRNFADGRKRGFHPVESHLTFPGSNGSLGTRLERNVASVLNIPRFDVHIHRAGADAPASIQQNEVVRLLLAQRNGRTASQTTKIKPISITAVR